MTFCALPKSRLCLNEFVFKLKGWKFLGNKYIAKIRSNVKGLDGNQLLRAVICCDFVRKTFFAAFQVDELAVQLHVGPGSLDYHPARDPSLVEP